MGRIKNVNHISTDRRTFILNGVDYISDPELGADGILTDISGNCMIRGGNRTGIGQVVAAGAAVASTVAGDGE